MMSTLRELRGPGRRIALLIGVVVLIFIAALAIAKWRYDKALDHYQELEAVEAQMEALGDAEQALLHRSLLATKALSVSSGVPDEVAQLRRQFHDALDEVVGTDSSDEALRLVKDVREAERELSRIEAEVLYPATGAAQQAGFEQFNETLTAAAENFDLLREVESPIEQA